MNSIARADAAATSLRGKGETPALSLSGLFRSNARRSPERAAFVDQPGRAAWSGRGDEVLSFAAADDAAMRLAGFFASLGLAPGTLVAVSLPSGTETPIVLAALDRAGLIPCLLPLAWSTEDIASIVERLGISCAVTQSRVGSLRPAEDWRAIAAGYFGLRFVLAFGPDVPDGVIDLDRMVGNDVIAPAEAATGGGYVSFDLQDGEPQAVFRSWSSALAAAKVFLAAADYAPQDRIVSLLAQDDHRSLTTGLMAALSAGSAIELHGLFSGRALVHSIGRGGYTRLVAPGWMEADLARLDLCSTLRGVTLVHRAPVRFKARAPLTHGVVDALAFGELALLAKARNSRGQFALSPDAPPVEDPDTKTQLLSVRRGESGEIFFQGSASETSMVARWGIDEASSDWRASGYVAEVFAGIVIGVSRMKK